MTTYWCEQARLRDGITDAVRVTIKGGRIRAVEAGADAAPGDTRLHGLTLPGFANAHSHAFHRLLRGRTHADGGTFWTWRQEMYAAARALDPNSYFVVAQGIYAEMLAAGYTAVGEFHYLHHQEGGVRYGAANAMGEALIEAARTVGIRLTLLDTCYLRGGLDSRGHLPLDEVQTRFSDGSVDQWAKRFAALREDFEAGRGGSVHVGAAAHSVRALDAEQLRRFAEVVAQWPTMPVHVHVSEQPAENDAVAQVYGGTPVAHLCEAGLLGPRLTAVHATHLTQGDIALLADTRTQVCVCPTTERDLADGIGPVRVLVDAGVPVCLGSDQHAVVDPFEEIRGVEMHERLITHERGRFAPDALLRMATDAGYRSLGHDLADLSVGALADFVTVRTDSRRTSGSRRTQIALSATSGDVTDVVVGGRHVISGGGHDRLGCIDEAIDRAVAAGHGAAQ